MEVQAVILRKRAEEMNAAQIALDAKNSEQPNVEVVK